LAAVGVGVPGPVDPVRGIGIFGPNIRWRNAPLAAMVRQGLAAADLEVPVFIDNDVRVAARAEFCWGAGKGCSDGAYITVGTGVGSGIVLGGRLFYGSSFIGGEVGHITVDPEGPVCGCGNRGCLETLAAAPAIARMARAVRPEWTDARDVHAAAQAQDPDALAILDRAAYYLSFGVGAFLNILNPELVIIGGGVSRAGEYLLGPLRRHLRDRAMPPAYERCRVVLARFTDTAGALGGIALAIERGRGDAPWTKAE